jgi:hypothetical protein
MLHGLEVDNVDELVISTAIIKVEGASSANRLSNQVEKKKVTTVNSRLEMTLNDGASSSMVEKRYK